MSEPNPWGDIKKLDEVASFPGEPADLRYETIKDEEMSEEQLKAVDAAHQWFTDTRRQILTIGGYAGTGKTTILKKIINRYPKKWEIGVSAFTGKAVSVLRRKGIGQAETIHSLMYERQGDDEHGRPTFKKINQIPYKIVIVDEASFISGVADRDLRSFGSKILYIGDHGQLKPIGEDPELMKNPDIRLEKIHRQAEDSILIKFASAVRNGFDDFKEKSFDELDITFDDDKFWDAARKADITIAGFNKTRHAANKTLRAHFGFDYLERMPQVGEKVICLRNNRDYNVYNGMTAKVTRSEHADRLYYLDVEDDLGNTWKNLPTVPEQYGKNSLANEHRKFGELLFDYGYCLTCHKAQGSEWGRVAILEEIWDEEWDPARWRYTAVTRGAEHVTYKASRG